MEVLITGCNTGIGLGTTAAFAERGDHVIAACLQTSPELSRLKNVTVVEGMDVTSDEAVAGLAEVVGPEGLDVLILNAGVNQDSPGLEDIDVARLMNMYNINALGAVRTVLALLPRMNEGGKIMFIGSGGMGTLQVLPYPSTGNYGYRMSKIALVSFAHGLARDIRSRGIAVSVTSPDAVDTPLLRGVLAEGRTGPAVLEMARDIETVGRMLRDRVDDLSMETSPAWHRTLAGEPAIPKEILAELEF
ncbi:SDR family NAD(P)-dependent oxidoreductase [Streptomyces sp. NPDC051985]|uniref:SDR family NAD(P)-dependent oxidoreductase n=1 Tax=Streptomyces sp. NPDC051985 TaxID=3155807 RepID=UPI003441109B